MAKDFAKSFYNSKAWQDCRASYIADRVRVDGGMCEHCKDVPGYIVDHITELTPNNLADPWIALGKDNLQFLCLSCHNSKTLGSSVTRDGLRFDADGQLVER